MATTEHTGTLKYVDGNGDINVLYPEIGKELTQAEYDALSEEEQKTGVYWITDGEGGNAGGGGGGATNALTPSDIVDNLESTATNLPLSANQGNVLNNNIKKCLQIVSFSGGTLTTKSF